MSENYSLNSSFGLNVSHKGFQQPNSQENASVESGKNAVQDLLNTIGGFFERHENVFNGNVEKEINMYSRQLMLIGMNLRATDKTIRRFDMNI